MNLFKRLKAGLKAKVAVFFAALGALTLSASASAASMLPSDISTTFGDVKTDILTVGGFVIGLAVVALAIRWVKATFF